MILIADASVIVDGRMERILETGLFDAALMFVPEYVMAELWAMSESDNDARRRAGRAGFESLTRMRRDFPRIVKDLVWPLSEKEKALGTDRLLAASARRLGAAVITNDQNAALFARAQGVRALMLSEIAQACLQPVEIGETATVLLKKKGKGARQATGSLPNEVFVVVDEAEHLIGREVEVEITNVIRTPGGVMAFASLTNEKEKT